MIAKQTADSALNGVTIKTRFPVDSVMQFSFFLHWSATRRSSRLSNPWNGRLPLSATARVQLPKLSGHKVMPKIAHEAKETPGHPRREEWSEASGAKSVARGRR